MAGDPRHLFFGDYLEVQLDKKTRNSQAHSILRLLFSLASLVTLTFVLNKPFKQFPSLGGLLNPFTGVWRPSANTHFSNLMLIGLDAPVEVTISSDRVKHVFASNDHDLYFIQGYLEAMDRLWQMDFLARVASGRLSEIVGRRGLEQDLLFLNFGIPDAAQDSLDLAIRDAQTKLALDSFAEGVNAYIENLKTEDLPFEFKLLGYLPEKWTPLRTILLTKLMALQLSGRSLDLPRTRSRQRLNDSDFNDLFPLQFDYQDSIIPPGASQVGIRAIQSPEKLYRAHLDFDIPRPQPHPGNGSNNWAVSGKLSSTGFPILANDIHLDYSLPSIFYEIQLTSPKQNVYGVTFPGVPGITVGFNENLAWGTTNAGVDVFDWFELKFRDSKKNEYFYQESWRPVFSTEHTIKVRGEKDHLVTLRKTHLGPLVFETDKPDQGWIGRGLAAKWEGANASNELASFLRLNVARNVEECAQALEEFSTPPQNILCADAKGHISIGQYGRYPLRFKGQGSVVSDGSRSEYAWKNYFAQNEKPFAQNPARGFLSSANQQPYSDRGRTEVAGHFEPPFRAQRINELLSNKKKYSPQDFIKMQSDTVSVFARQIVPVLLMNVHGEKLNSFEKVAYDILLNWRFDYSAELPAPVIFEEWWRTLESHLWQPYFSNPTEFLFPSRYKLAELLVSPVESKWFDDPTTSQKESRKNRIIETFHLAISKIENRFGGPKKWRWSSSQTTQIMHLARIPGLGSDEFDIGGSPYSIFANSGRHGPVWSMVVSLGPKIQAWGNFPGGITGDPLDPGYDGFLGNWQKHDLRELQFLSQPQKGALKFTGKVVQ